MNKDCNTCLCKEGACYPSATIFDKDKTCKSYAPDYEGYIADLERKLEQAEKDLADYQFNYPTIKELQKENAELKNRDCWKSCEYANPKAELIEQHLKDVQNLAKAKELLNDFICYANLDDCNLYIKEQAEQFLKEFTPPKV